MEDSISLSGKGVIVTGATTGIGRASAIRLAKAGAKVLLLGRTRSILEEARDEAAEHAGDGGEAHAVVADVTKREDVERAFAEADGRLGDVDILVNNAGVSAGDLAEGDWDDWRTTLDTNILGAAACCRAAADRMKPRQAGHILMVGSMSADLRSPSSVIYSASKAAVQAMGESLRKQLNPEGIRVTVVEPGAVDTPMQGDDLEERRRKVAAGEMLEADDIARAIEYCLLQPARCDVVLMQVRPIGQPI